jgi:hypothetical protein
MSGYSTKRINIFQEKLVFQAGSKAPVVFPPGYFGDGETECQATPPSEYEEEDLEEDRSEEDLETDRFQEMGPEDDYFPDESYFDVGHEPEVANHTLYRLYDVFIHTASDPLCSQQIYVMHDFKYGSNEEIEIVPNRFAVVTLLNLSFADGHYPVSTCSLCQTNSLLSAYMQSDWSRTSQGSFEPSMLYSCFHVNAVVSYVTHKAIPDNELPHDYSPTYAVDVAELLAELLIRAPIPLMPGSFILKELKYRVKYGELLIYLSEYDGIYLFAKARSTSGRGYLFCFLCPRSRSCSHISMVGPLDPSFYQFEESIHAESYTTARNRPLTDLQDVLLSKRRYPFDMDEDEELREIIRDRMFTPITHWYENNVPGGIIIAEPRKCCGSDCEIISTNNHSCELFSLHGYLQTKPIQARICRICHARYEFDGRALGILNYSNKYLFTVELILDLLEFKSLSGTPTYSYWQARCNTMLKSWTSEETIYFKKKWMSMAGRVNGIMTPFFSLVDYPANHFQCCKDPEVVCIDGIVLSVESRRINTQTPWIDDSGLRARFSTKEDRYTIMLNPKQKEILKSYIREGVHLEDLKIFCAEVDEPMGTFIIQNASTFRQGATVLVQSPPLLKRFYQSLYKHISPACSIVPACTWSLLEGIVAQNHIPFEYFPILSQQAPVLADLCSYITKLSGNVSKYHTGILLLKHILTKSKGCYSSPRPNYQNPIRPVSNEERISFTSVTQEVLETGAYFPGRPYHSIIRDIHLTKESTLCNKLYKSKGRLGAGTLLFWCGVHRKCLGFYVMQSAESCKTVFQILVTRFRVQPKVIIYDNGCNLSEYILNRAPGPFKDTYILSDGFHWKNHTNCGMAYNSKLYPALNGIYT